MNAKNSKIPPSAPKLNPQELEDISDFDKSMLGEISNRSNPLRNINTTSQVEKILDEIQSHNEISRNSDAKLLME